MPIVFQPKKVKFSKIKGIRQEGLTSTHWIDDLEKGLKLIRVNWWRAIAVVMIGYRDNAKAFYRGAEIVKLPSQILVFPNWIFYLQSKWKYFLWKKEFMILPNVSGIENVWWNFILKSVTILPSTFEIFSKLPYLENVS